MRSTRSQLPEDRTTKARIRDAAIACFGRRGVANTSLRMIAAAADVAPSHIIHYYGSKDGLRQACDQYIATLLRTTQETVVNSGERVDPLTVLRTFEGGTDMLRYFARLLTEHDSSANELIDQIIADSLAYIQGLAQAGWITPGSRERDLLLVMFSLGQVALGEHATRWTGADYVHMSQDPASLAPVLRAYIEFGSRPLLTPKGKQLMVSMMQDGPDPPPAP